MKRALLHEPFKFVIEEHDIPEPGPGKVLVNVAACGICGTDINAFTGNNPSGWHIVYPFQMGHELSGIIAAVGPEVPDRPGLRVGDRVVPDGRLPCRRCHYCRRGLFNLCTDQGYVAGGFSEYAVYPYRNLVAVPDGVSLEHAAFGEPLGCVVNGNGHIIDPPLGGVGVVIGTGPIGMLHLQILKSRGLMTVGVDLRERRLNVAEELGADVTIQARTHHEVDQNVVDRVMEITDGRGAEVVVSAAGNDTAVLDEAIKIAAKRGQILYFAATLSDPATVNLEPIHYRELRLVGSHDSTTARYETALALLKTGAVNVEPIITHRFPLEETQEAFEFARTREGIKVMVVNENL
jgi:L-iditol 2-dehydrogenase